MQNRWFDGSIKKTCTHTYPKRAWWAIPPKFEFEHEASYKNPICSDIARSGGECAYQQCIWSQPMSSYTKQRQLY